MPWNHLVLDYGRLVLALASQNTWNVLSEIIPTSDLKNDLHDILSQAKISSKLHHFHSACLFSVGFPKSNAHALHFAVVSSYNAYRFSMETAQLQ